ncbi:PREDICTED: WD repeat-containing protein 55 [Nanorana parkeri]|uniref:WD repeat-containing protein 55 n=1 Tax=Nanorana parkeri TaxID=125878 RepID=UPI000854920A|nr:PREDICTED: WD repeat-containing protein 55 [Nanorana parkeri]
MEGETEELDDTSGPAEPRVRDTPGDITFEAAVNTIAFHPTRDILAAGDLDGDVFVYSYSCVEDGNKELWSSGHHLKSCRDSAFSTDGQQLFTISKDKSIHIMNVEEGKLVKRITKAHDSPPFMMVRLSREARASLVWCLRSPSLVLGKSFLPIHWTVVTTDVGLLGWGGVLDVWTAQGRWSSEESRLSLNVLELRAIRLSLLHWTADPASSELPELRGDGTMGVFNIKRRRFELLSEYQNGDLTSISIMKRGKKVACGSSEGTIYLFNWNGFGATSDRFAVKAESIDCMIPVNDHIVCTGSMDGVIRAINILPNRVIGTVGQHPGEPIEQLAKSYDGKFLASCAHDQKVKFWDVSSIGSIKVDVYRKRKKNRQLPALSKKAFGGADDFFADLNEETSENKEEEEAEDEDSDDTDSD